MHRAPPLPRCSVLVGLAVAIALGVAYFLAGPDQQSEDANRYLYGVETGWRAWDPNHLLYTPTMRAAFLAAEGIGAVSRAYNVVRLASAFVAAVGPVLLAAVLCRAGIRRTVAFAAAAALALSPVWIRYSTVAETYQFPVAFALVALLAWLEALRTARAAMWLAAGAGMGVAGLFHQTGALSGVALAIATVAAPADSARERLRRTAVVCLGGGGLAAVAFVFAGAALGHATPSALLDWLRGLERVSTVWGRADHYSLPGIAQHARAWGHAWSPFPGSVVAGVFAFLAAFAAAAWNARRSPLATFALAGLAIHSLFNVWWAPWEWEFIVAAGATCAIPAVALAADRIADRIPAPKHRAAIAIAACVAIVACGALAWKRQALAFRDRLASRPVEVAFGLEAARAAAGEDALFVADFAVRDALHLYAAVPPVVAFEDLLEPDGSRRVSEAFAAGRPVVVDAIPPAVPMRDERIQGTARAVRALLDALADSEDTLPEPAPMPALGIEGRVFAFMPSARRIPRADAVRVMIECARASIAVPIPEAELQPLRDAAAPR